MKRPSGVAITTLVVFAIAIYVYFFEFKKGKQQEEQKDKAALLFSDFNASDLIAIELSGPKEYTALEKREGGWMLKTPVQDTTEKASVENFISAAFREKTNSVVVDGSESKSAATAIDFKTFGLDQPLGHILFKTAKAAREISFGSVKAFDGSLYARIDNENLVRSVSPAWDQTLNKTAFDFRTKELYRQPLDADWDTIKIYKQGKLQTQLQKDKNGFKLLLDKNIEVTKNFSQKIAHNYLQQLKDLRAVEYVFEKKQDSDDKGFKLDKPFLLITLNSAKLKTQWALKLSQPQEKAKPLVATKTEISSVFATSTDIESVVRVYANAVKAFDKKPNDFLEDEKAAAKPTDNSAEQPGENLPAGESQESEKSE